ncbi:MAG: hypothetical protein ACKOBW_03105 [Planctomycetota bacterium]
MPRRRANSEPTWCHRWRRSGIGRDGVGLGGVGQSTRPTGRSLKLLVFICTLSIVGGGTSGCVTGRPNLAHPGNLQTQRFNAIAHDPYADPDLGPEVVGGRPREFQKNLAEPVRNRWLMDSWWARTATGR